MTKVSSKKDFKNGILLESDVEVSWRFEEKELKSIKFRGRQ